MNRLTPEQVETFARLLRDETKYSSRINPEVLTMLIQAARDLPALETALQEAREENETLKSTRVYKVIQELTENNAVLREQLEAARGERSDSGG